MSMSRGSAGLPPVTPPKRERGSLLRLDSFRSDGSRTPGATPLTTPTGSKTMSRAGSTGTLRDLHYGRMAQLGQQRSRAPAGGVAADRLYTATAGYMGHVPHKETEGIGFGQSWAKGCQLAKQRRTSSLPRLSQVVP